MPGTHIVDWCIIDPVFERELLEVTAMVRGQLQITGVELDCVKVPMDCLAILLVLQDWETATKGSVPVIHGYKATNCRDQPTRSNRKPQARLQQREKSRNERVWLCGLTMARTSTC